MAKVLIGVLCVAALLQFTLARDVSEALNHNIREQLKGYESLLAENDNTHKDDLKKLVQITESALKANTVDEKQAILKGVAEHFTPEFNTYITEKLEEINVNDDIHDAIEFYKSLLTGNTEFKAEIEKTIATLEGLQKETNLKQKEDNFLDLNKAFTPAFQKFLSENSLPKVNQELQKSAEFFENLLAEDNNKFATEIKELKKQTETALGNISVEEKQSALFKVTNPENRELFEYLQKKFIELN